MVAPRVGAWIETCLVLAPISPAESRPAWARGLKQAFVIGADYMLGRAPRGRVD